MESSVEHMFSVEAMVRGYHEYKNAWDAPIGEMLNFACYHHLASNPEVCLCMHWQKKHQKMVFSRSTLHSGWVEAVYQ